MADDPYGQLKALSLAAPAGLPIVIDEVQREPGITLSLKRIVDENPRTGHFLLTGSADIFSHGAAIDSLADRVATLALRPFSLAEIHGSGPCRLLDAVAAAPDDPMPLLIERAPPRPYARTDVIDLIVRGGYPEIRRLGDRDRGERYQNYVDSVIERDLAAIHPVRKPDAVRRLLYQAAPGPARS